MTSVVMRKATLALFSDLSRQVVLPHMTAMAPERSYEGVSVRFLGDRYGTPFRGEGRGRRWSMTVRYPASEQADLAALLDLIDDAADLPDSRLFLRTHHGQAEGVDDAMAVIVLSVAPSPQVGLYVDVTLACEAVEFTLAV